MSAPQLAILILARIPSLAKRAVKKNAPTEVGAREKEDRELRKGSQSSTAVM
jgi:hypothetical protein